MIQKIFFDLTTDHRSGRFLATKIGEVVVGIVWTMHMLAARPAEWEMWLAYAGTVMGWSSVRYYFKNKKQETDSAQSSPA